MYLHTVVLKTKIHLLSSNCSCDYIFYNDLPFFKNTESHVMPPYRYDIPHCRNFLKVLLSSEICNTSVGVKTLQSIKSVSPSVHNSYLKQMLKIMFFFSEQKRWINSMYL